VVSLQVAAMEHQDQSMIRHTKSVNINTLNIHLVTEGKLKDNRHLNKPLAHLLESVLVFIFQKNDL